MLYTVVPAEVIYSVEIKPPIYKQQNGVLVEMRADASGKDVVTRIHTSDLKKYLSKEFNL